MNQERIKNAIAFASNVAVVVTAIVILISFARGYRPTPRLSLQGGLRKGAAFPQLPAIDFSKSQKTLLVAMDSKCDYCNESLPFFKNLAENIRARSNDARVIALFQSEESKRYVEQNQLNMDVVFGVDFKALNLSAIPAIILIDNNGTILDLWFGKPSKNSEEQIIKGL